MTVNSAEFQVVILAGGRGSRMMDLSDGRAKCLLPIGNRPMIWYTLNNLRSLGFQEAIVLTQEHARPEILSLCKKLGVEMHLDMVTLPNNQEDLGTADAMRLVHDKLVADNVLVVSSDLLIQSKHVRHLTDLHRVHRSSVTAIFAPRASNADQVQVPGHKAKHKLEKDLVGLDSVTGQLCSLTSEADLDDQFSLKLSLMRQHPNLVFHSNLVDAHLYIFSRAICDFIMDNKEFTALKGELLPYLVRSQFRRANRSCEPDRTAANDDVDAALNLKPEAPCGDDKQLASYIHEDPMLSLTRTLSSWNDHRGDLKACYRNRPMRCYAYLMEEVGGCVRANSTLSYWDINRHIREWWPLVCEAEEELQLLHASSQVQSKAHVASDCLVGADTRIANKTTIKSCVIGAHCVIEENVRLTNCVLMDKVCVRSGASLQGSLVCDDVVVGAMCDLKDTIVCRGQTLPDKAKLTHEVLNQDKDQLMEI